MKAFVGVVSVVTLGGLGVAFLPIGHGGDVPSVTVPLYGAGLGAGQPAAAAEPAWVKRLEDRVGAVDAKLDKLLKLIEEDPAAPPKADVHAADPNLQAAAEVCARCHSPGVAAESGGNFTLFNEDGAFRNLSDRDVDKIVAEVSRGRMPPPKKAQLTKEQQAAFLAAFGPKK